MTYIVTPDLGLELPDPLTIQPFETTNVNSNFLLLEAGIVADRVRLGALETDSETLLDRVTARPADFNALAALATAELLSGDLAYVTEGGVFMVWSGSTWAQVTTSVFASTAARDTAYAKASGAYLVLGVAARITADGLLYVRESSQWVADRAFATATAQAGYTVNAQAVRRDGRVVTVFVDASKISGNWTGVVSPVAQIPAAFRPDGHIVAGVIIENASGAIRLGYVDTNGFVQFNVPGTVAGSSSHAGTFTYIVDTL